MIFTIVKQLWQKNLVLKCLILICLPLLIVTLWSGLPIVAAKICVYLLFVLGFSCFDNCHIQSLGIYWICGWFGYNNFTVI